MAKVKKFGKGSGKKRIVKSRKKLKLKTRKGAAKRFKLTASGKVKRKRSSLRHILTSKTTKQKRHLRSKSYVHASNMEKIRLLMPNG